MACVCGPGRRPPRRLPLPAGDWRPLPPLQLPRFGAAACVLDGRPVVVGGVGPEGVTAKAERYNAAQGVPRAAAVPQHSAFFLRSCCLPMHASLSAPPPQSARDALGHTVGLPRVFIFLGHSLGYTHHASKGGFFLHEIPTSFRPFFILATNYIDVLCSYIL